MLDGGVGLTRIVKKPNNTVPPVCSIKLLTMRVMLTEIRCWNMVEMTKACR